MVVATVFVWEEKDWGVRKGYVYSLEKTNEVARLLEEQAEWVVSFDVGGFNLMFKDIENLEIKDGKVVVRSVLV